MTTGDRIAATAGEWVGTPFLWQGRVKGKGCDCKWLVAGVFAECELPEAQSVEALAGDYGKRVDSARLIAGLQRMFDRVETRAPGDLLLVYLGGKPQHLAIAAPTPAKPLRAIQAMDVGPRCVVAVGVPRGSVHSIWRRRGDA